MLAALQANLGVVTPALKLADISRDTYYRWLKEDKAFLTATQEVRNIAIDFTESKLFQVIGGYKMPDSKVFADPKTGKKVIVSLEKHVGPDGPSIRWYLGCIAKDRGYRQNADQGDGNPLAEPDTITLPNGQQIQL